MSIYEKLGQIQKTLKAPKNQRNKFGGYNYRSCEDILEAVKPLLDGCVLTVSDEVVSLGDRFYIKATARLALSGDEFVENTAWAREPETKKGMDEAQITGATSSYARKYALKVPIPPHLVEEVLSKKGYIIADRFGKFDVQRFSRYFKKIRDILGFDERYIFKNMRHTGSTAYVEAGVATNAIISITGHTNEAIFNQVYKGNTEEVTLPALKKRLEAESRNNKIKESE